MGMLSIMAIKYCFIMEMLQLIRKEKFLLFVCFFLGVLIFAGCGENEKVTSVVENKQDAHVDPNKYPGMVYIPAGEFIMGTDPKKEKDYSPSLGFTNNPYHDEVPERKLYLKGFYIDKYEVTMGQYAEFTKATGTEFPEAIEKLDIEKYKNYPVSCVTWYDAAEYAQWANKKLPTEAQWEKAARGTGRRRYPWGNKIKKTSGNFSRKGIFPVGTYKDDVSPYGVYGMAGSLDEWVVNWYKPYPGHNKDCVEDDSDFGESYKVYRGGSWGGQEGHLHLFEYTSRVSHRGYENPYVVSNTSGFRCVIEE